MEAATKKRGRPRKYETMENIFSDKEPRAAQNLYHATVTIEQFAEGKTDSFFRDGPRQYPAAGHCRANRKDV